jgi:nucleoid-associated protein YgaU
LRILAASSAFRPESDTTRRVVDGYARYGDLTADITIDTTLPVPSVSDVEQPRIYEVVSGDSLSKIAKHFYGDAAKYPKIFEANLDQLKDPNVIRPGQKLKIPV